MYMSSRSEIEESLLRARLYRVLLRRYADLINEKEKRTIGQVKSLVDANDLTIQSLAGSFKSDPYSFDMHYLKAAEKALDWITHEIAFVKTDLRLSYWLSPKEIVENKVADDEDQAVFLCSILSALGDAKAEVVIAELEDLSTHAFVATDYQSRFFLFDPSQLHSLKEFSGFKEQVLAKYHFNGSRIKRFLYKFNHSNYEQFL